MSELPADPLSRIESMVEIIGIAHAAIFAQHRLLIDLGGADENSRALLDESVQIVFAGAPKVTRNARSLAERWAVHQLLDPKRGETTRSLLAGEIEETERALEALLARQEVIASELRKRAAGATGE